LQVITGYSYHFSPTRFLITKIPSPHKIINCSEFFCKTPQAIKISKTVLLFVNFRIGERFLERLPASFPNLKKLTLERCFEGDQTAVKALLNKISKENPGLEIQESLKRGQGWQKANSV